MESCGTSDGRALSWSTRRISLLACFLLGSKLHLEEQDAAVHPPRGTKESNCQIEVKRQGGNLQCKGTCKSNLFVSSQTNRKFR